VITFQSKSYFFNNLHAEKIQIQENR